MDGFIQRDCFAPSWDFSVSFLYLLFWGGASADCCSTVLSAASSTVCTLLSLGLPALPDLGFDLGLGFFLDLEGLVMPVGSPPSPQGHDKVPDACLVVILHLLPESPYWHFLWYSGPPVVLWRTALEGEQ